MLPGCLADTQFKLVPGVATILRDPLFTWNQVLGRYVISGFIKPRTAADFERLVVGLPEQGWHEEESRHVHTYETSLSSENALKRVNDACVLMAGRPG